MLENKSLRNLVNALEKGVMWELFHLLHIKVDLGERRRCSVVMYKDELDYARCPTVAYMADFGNAPAKVIYAAAADMVVIMDKGQVKWVGNPATYASSIRQVSNAAQACLSGVSLGRSNEEPEDEEPEIMKTMKKLYNRKKGKEMVDEADDDPKETDEEPIQSEGKKKGRNEKKEETVVHLLKDKEEVKDKGKIGDPVVINTRMSPRHLKDVLKSFTPQQLGLWIVKNFDPETDTIRMVDGRKIKACLDDFSHHNIDVACNLLDTCGRYLYGYPDTNVRMANMLEILMRLKNVKNLDPRHSTLVENAYYLCKPPE
ncbi:regulator of nonsense transcripts UPF2 [Tanacetum coccineum]